MGFKLIDEAKKNSPSIGFARFLVSVKAAILSGVVVLPAAAECIYRTR